jgi:hypothetical protein
MRADSNIGVKEKDHSKEPITQVSLDLVSRSRAATFMERTKSSFDELQRIAWPYGFRQGWTNEAGHHFSFGDENARFPITINAEPKREDEFFIYGHVRTYGLASCRTDLHDWIGSLWAICCRGLEISSVWIVDEGGFARDEEIYGRIIVFSQPSQSTYRVTAEPDRLELGGIFAASSVFAQVLSEVWCACKISVNDEFDYGEDSLPADLLTAFSGKSKDTVICGRRSACVNYYRDAKKDISITDFRECREWHQVSEHLGKRNVIRAEATSSQAESSTAVLIRSGKIRNVISKHRLARLRKMIGKLAGTATRDICIFPCDSHLIAISQDGICSMRAESGARLYARAFRELSTLHQDIQFEWSANPDAGRFEHFVLDLLNGNPEVRRARPRGHPNEPDSQSDLTAEVYISFLRNERMGPSEGKPENDIVQLVVQCKTSIRNVGKGKVTDIRDTVDRHFAAGFLLVALPGVTNDLTEYIESIRSKKLFWIDCWTKPELEAELRSNPSVAAKYSDLVKLTAPPMEQP